MFARNYLFLSLLAVSAMDAGITRNGQNVTLFFDDFTIDPGGPNEKVVSGGTLVGPSDGNHFAGFQPYASAVNPDIPAGFGFNISVASSQNPDYGALYKVNVIDSDPDAGRDPDLHGGPDGKYWKGGNLDRDTYPSAPILTNVLVAQEIGSGGYAPTVAELQAGAIDPSNVDDAVTDSVTFDYEYGITSFGFIWADNEEETMAIEFYDSVTGGTARVTFADFTDPTFAYYDSTIVFADHYANQFPEMDIAVLAGLDLFKDGSNNTVYPTLVDQVTFDFGGSSGGIANISFTSTAPPPIPEPSALISLVMLGGFARIGLRRRR